MKKKEKFEEACFGAGCFWHIEEEYSKTLGVIETAVGYMGGDEKNYSNPTYHQVCSDETGHVEVVHLKFDPKKTDYNKLLNIFFRIHDPTSFNRQGADIGSQYKSIIFYYNSGQKKMAEDAKKYLERRIKRKIATEIKPATTFFKAEDYHQKYFKKHKLVCNVMNFFANNKK